MSMFLRRRDATQATFDHFVGVPMRYGHVDCVQMAAFHLNQMGICTDLAPAGSYKTARGGVRVLKRLGYKSLAGALDGLGFVRIAPAFAWVGDIMELPGDAAPGALAVVLSNGRVLGFHENLVGADALQPLAPTVAWRILPGG